MSSLSLFIWYAPSEKTPYLRDLLTKLEEEKIADLRIDSGSEIGGSHDSADIVLLLLSTAFLTECLEEKALERLLQKQEEGTARVILVQVRTCNLKNFHRLQEIKKLPSNGSVLADSGLELIGYYDQIIDHVREAINDLGTTRNILHLAKSEDDVPGARMAKNICQLQEKKKIFLSTPESVAGAKKRKEFLYQVLGKQQYEGWPYQIVPTMEDLEKLRQLNDEQKKEYLSDLIQDSLYSIHIIAEENELEHGIDRFQFEACREYTKTAFFHKLIVWVLLPEVKEKLNEQIYSHPVSTGNDFENIFDIIRNLDLEKEQKLTASRNAFAPGKTVLLFYNFKKDHNNNLRRRLKSRIEAGQQCSVRFNAVRDNITRDKTDLEKCEGAFIFYGEADPEWFMVRQSLLFEASKRCRAICLDEPHIKMKFERDVKPEGFVTTIRGERELESGVRIFLENLLNDAV